MPLPASLPDTAYSSGSDSIRDDRSATTEPASPRRRFSDELVEEAREVFQKRTDRTVSSEDARMMLENLVGYFTTLHEWDRLHRRLGTSRQP